LDNLKNQLDLTNNLRKDLLATVSKIFAADPRYPHERALTRKVQRQIQKMAEISKQRFNLNYAFPIVKELVQYYVPDGDPHLTPQFSPMIAARSRANFAIVQSLLPEIRLEMPALNNSQITQNTLTWLNRQDQTTLQSLTKLYNTLTKDVKTLHALRLTILDQIPGTLPSKTISIQPPQNPLTRSLTLFDSLPSSSTSNSEAFTHN
ncbi:hypothetical protein HDU76_012130, partial [Blyttiomyces sp. JEL0837]